MYFSNSTSFLSFSSHSLLPHWSPFGDFCPHLSALLTEDVKRHCQRHNGPPYGTLRTGDVEDSDVEDTTLRTCDFEDGRLWGQATLRTGEFEDRRLWGQILCCNFETKNVCPQSRILVRLWGQTFWYIKKMHISQPGARRAPRNPPNDIYSQVLAAYIQ